MKNLAVLALCFVSSFASAKEIEEVVVSARRVVVVLEKLSENHKQDPKTGDWHYVEQKNNKA
jgi:hypothetical protein